MKKKSSKAKLAECVRYELWLSLDKAVCGFCYPPIGERPFDYEDDPESFVQIASQCWAEIGGKSEIDGKIRAYQWDRIESAKFIQEQIPGSYIEQTEVREE